MKNLRKLMAGLMAVMMIMSISAVVLAEGEDGPHTLGYYGSYTGTVKEFDLLNDWLTYAVEADGEVIANVVTDDNTVFISEDEIKVGDTVQAFYDTNAPMPMIYPPLVTAAVIAVNLPDDQSVKVDRFDEELISADGGLKLNISDNTEIFLQDGTAFDGEIATRALAVVYDVSTKSIPAQTTPVKIIVLFEKPMTLPIDVTVTEEDDAQDVELPLDGEINGDIIVNGVKIDAPAPFVNDAGFVMVPLRAVAEALGFTVTWDEETQSVMLNNSISLSIGKDYYTYARMAPIELGAAPELRDDRTFVPLIFFRDVARADKVGISEGQIIIDIEE